MNPPDRLISEQGFQPSATGFDSQQAGHVEKLGRKCDEVNTALADLRVFEESGAVSVEAFESLLRFRSEVMLMQARKVSDKRLYLKIKLKSLAAEARIIRREELRQIGDMRQGLYHHRVGVVRTEARATHLAYGFIRGRTYKQMEPKVINMSAFDVKKLQNKVEAMVEKYGSTTVGLKEWWNAQA